VVEEAIAEAEAGVGSDVGGSGGDGGWSIRAVVYRL